MVVRYRFGQEDLLRTRFAIAPVMDLLGAFYVLRDPGRSVVHRPWREWVLPRTAEARPNATLMRGRGAEVIVSHWRTACSVQAAPAEIVMGW